VDAARYKPTRSQRRAWNRHRHLQVKFLKLGFDPEHYAMFLRYQTMRHAGGGMDEDSAEQYTQFLLQSRVNTRLIEFREIDENDEIGILKMVSIVDILNDGLSAFYTFYEPEANSNYGTYNIMWQIKQAKILNMDFLYLGFWIAESKKMRYKADFSPYQILSNGKWID
jgi:arginine-tRNA-protein transferase